jgi:hypothetical protein
MYIQPFTAYTAKLLLMRLSNIQIKQTSFNRLKRDHGLDMDTLLKMEREGLISISGCTLSGEIVDHYKSIVRKYAHLYGYDSAPSEVDHEEQPWHVAFYRDNWPFPKKYYDAFEADSSLLRTEVELEDILTPERVHIWLNWGDVRYPLFCLRFDLGINEKKLRSFLKEYTEAFINGSMEDQKEHLSYKIQKDALMNYLGAKVGAGVDHNGVWIVPSQDGYESYKDMKFVWSGSDVALVRPVEAILSLEHEGFITLLEIEDHSGGSPDHFWGMFLQYKILITNKGLKFFNLPEPDSRARPLQKLNLAKGIISFTDDRGRKGEIKFQARSKQQSVNEQEQQSVNKQEGILKELWDNRRVTQQGKIINLGNDTTLENLRSITRSVTTKAVEAQINRLNTKFLNNKISVVIRSIGATRRRLDIECVNTPRNKSERS